MNRPAPLRSGRAEGLVRRYWHLAAAAAVASGTVIAADALLNREPPAKVESWALRKPGYGPASYAEALAALDQRVAAGHEYIAREPDNWLRMEGLSRALLARSRLTGSYDDLAQAVAVMDRARAIPPDPAGPVLSDAELGMAVHQLGRTERALAALRRWAVPPDRDERREAAALAGDLAFYRGDMDGARKAYAEAAKIDGGMAFRTAVLAKAQGDFDDAKAGLRAHLAAMRSPSPQQVANLALQLGAVELARGNAAEARRRFEEANRLFPGFWLTEAHLAQAKALAGDLPGAIAQMRGVAERSGTAETMDALAMLLRAQGQAAESRQWAGRAGALWARRLAQLPEASYGHAIEHELVFGTPPRALDLAQRNLAARPYGESRLLLASALIQNGRTAEALEQLRLAETSGWRSAPLHALRAQALELAGRPDEAERARNTALALNPHIFAPETALVWFSHG